MEDQLLNLALLGKPHDMIDAAKFYEKTNDMQNKAGRSYNTVMIDTAKFYKKTNEMQDKAGRSAI